MGAINKSGIEPLSDRVLVKPDDEDNLKKQTFLAIPEAVEDKYNLAQVMGVLVATGPVAWAEEKRLYGADVALKPGTRVMFAKYAGIQVNGEDGEKYRLIYDRDVTALVTSDVRMQL